MDTVLTFIPPAHGKAVRSAFYNTVALAILGTITLVASSVYFYVLQPYLRPLLWAGLVGSVLYPLKERIAVALKSWLAVVEESHKPAVVEVLFLPFVVIDGSYTFCRGMLSSHWRTLFSTTFGFLVCLGLHYSSPMEIGRLFEDLYAVMEPMTTRMTTFWLYFAISVLLAYYIIVLTLPASQLHPSGSEESRRPTICEKIPQFRPARGDLRQRAIANALAKNDMLLGDGDEGNAFSRRALRWSRSSSSGRQVAGSTPDVSTDSGRRVSFMTSTPRARSVSESNEPAFNSEASLSNDVIASTPGAPGHQPPPLLIVDPPPEVKESRSNSVDLPSSKDLLDGQHVRPRAYSDSCRRPPMSARSYRSVNRTNFAARHDGGPMNSEGNVYLVSLIWMWILMELWTHPRLFQLLPIPAFYLILKHSWLYLSESKRLSAFGNRLWQRIEAKKHLLVPFPIPCLYRLVLRGERALLGIFADYVDSVASICIIAAGVMLSGLALIFISIQVYQEGVLLISLSGQALNSTIVGTFMGSGEMAKLMHQSTDSIHHYGRVLLSSFVRQISGDMEEAKLMEVENQLMDVWNKFYDEYNKYLAHEVRNYPEFTEPEPIVDPSCNNPSKMVSIGVQTSPEPSEFSWISLSHAMKLMPGSLPKFNSTILTQFVRNNVDLMQSIASIVASNLYLAVGGLTALLGLLAGGGTAVLNFVLNWLIFCTALFYLLKSSNSMYKPVDFLASLTQSTTQFAMAFDRAISDVFVVSFKLALFYALWTWIVHDFFEVKLVFVPSAIASILAVVPLFGSYLVCIPGAVELWAVQNRSTAAVVFFFAHLIPPYFVNDAFYRDIRGDSHPYLTSLAVMGGVLCLGVEGAIFGPVLLCLLLIVYQTFKWTVHDTPLLRIFSGEHSGYAPPTRDLDCRRYRTWE